MTALLTGILAVIATALDYSGNVTQSDVQREAGSVTLVIALVLLAVLLVAYYAGGYVAGRMSRFDGARQGVAVWFVGLLVTVAAAVLGWVAGDQYNLLDRVDVPRVPDPHRQRDAGRHRHRRARARWGPCSPRSQAASSGVATTTAWTAPRL